jgi:hypothetical protein
MYEKILQLNTEAKILGGSNAGHKGNQEIRIVQASCHNLYPPGKQWYGAIHALWSSRSYDPYTIALTWSFATICYRTTQNYEADFTGRLGMYEAWGCRGA